MHRIQPLSTAKRSSDDKSLAQIYSYRLPYVPVPYAERGLDDKSLAQIYSYRLPYIPVPYAERGLDDKSLAQIYSYRLPYIPYAEKGSDDTGASLLHRLLQLRGLDEDKQQTCGVTSQVSAVDQVTIVNKHNEVREQSGASAMLTMVSPSRVVWRYVLLSMQHVHVHV